ncbi:MAG: UDP-glucose/GDP-mannose dehydrogenase family protein [Terriglobia bacterium]|nr:UDP-glucose/GDP-mannose dehydrogenase family protein [Terriglobia bacterium]
MNIAIIGSGYVGLVAAACMAEVGHHVISVDNDESKIQALRRGECIIHEEFLPELLKRHSGDRLIFTSSLHEAVRASSIVFIAVGTPPCETGEADLSVLESVCHDIAVNIDRHKVIVVKSTVPVGTNDWVKRILIRYGASPKLFCVASNPEFLREGTAVTDFLFPDRIVIGSDCLKSRLILEQAYLPLTLGTYARTKGAIPIPDAAPLPAPMIVTHTRSAEMIKHASNAFLAMKVSFINAVANLCESAGADIQEVCEGMGSDQRIGNKFLKPGIGYGGSCFPKDLTALHSAAREYGCGFHLLEEVMRINEDQRKFFLRKVRNVLWTLKGKRLAVLGLAFKGGTDDIRESPAIALVKMLLKEKCQIVAYDPAAMDRAREELESDSVTFAASAYDAAKGADAMLVLTDWEEFTALDFDRMRKELRHPILIDGRNLYSLQEMERRGFNYVSVGRPETVPGRVRDVEIGKTEAA